MLAETAQRGRQIARHSKKRTGGRFSPAPKSMQFYPKNLLHSRLESFSLPTASMVFNRAAGIPKAIKPVFSLIN